MAQCNRIRKLWYSWAKLVVSWAAVLVGAVFVVVSIVLFAMQEWLQATGALLAAAPLLGTSIGLMYSTTNEPKMVLCTSQEEANGFMRDFISRGSSAHIASFRLSWVRGSEEMQRFLANAAQEGKEITVFAMGPDDFTERLKTMGIRVRTYPAETADTPRFTFLNVGRYGSKWLAVAREGFPSHWIDVYNDRQHPQVLAIASAYLALLEKLA